MAVSELGSTLAGHGEKEIVSESEQQGRGPLVHALA